MFGTVKKRFDLASLATAGATRVLGFLRRRILSGAEFY
jgi:hypothetical protein